MSKLQDYKEETCYVSEMRNKNIISLSEISLLSDKNPNEILITILNQKSGVLSILEENNVNSDILAYVFIVFGKACSSDESTNVNNLIQAFNFKHILLYMQRYLVSVQKQENLKKYHFDSIFFITILLEKFQNIMPSTSSDFVSILLPLLESTCARCLKVDEDMHGLVLDKLKEINEQNQHFLSHHNLLEMKEESKRENLPMEEPPESFRSLPVLPTVDDIHSPCMFLRPNIVKGKYKNTEHYLDVQYRLLREDFVKPLRDGIAEYIHFKKIGRSLKDCANVKVYTHVRFAGEVFEKGDLLHVLKFSDKDFSKIKWESSQRFMSDSLLCLSVDDFSTMSFASVALRDPDELKKGFLYVRFEEITKEVFSINQSTDFVVIETPSAYFESYRYNLTALQNIETKTLPFETYIINVKKTVGTPQYLETETIYDMRPLLVPLDEKNVEITHGTACYKYQENISDTACKVKVLGESWPTATDFNLDQSQYFALKSAITKEFSIIQGPPGTGKTYIGLRIVQLLLHNLSSWFSYEINSLPILIVCHTNHALDQFLEGLLLFTENIARIGGGCKNNKISKYHLAVRYSQISKYINKNIYEAIKRKQCIQQEMSNVMECIKMSAKTVLSEREIQMHINPIHFRSLKNLQLNQTPRKSRSSLNNWLGCRKDNEWSHNKSGWMTEEHDKNNFQMDKYIENCLKYFQAMPEKMAVKIRNVWGLDHDGRWELYKFWLQNYIEKQLEKCVHLHELLKFQSRVIKELHTKKNLCALEDVHVVGLTTSGAAKHWDLVQKLNPAILVVEEAAEVLECHIVTSLAPGTKHVILIGDQQQLRPSPAVHMLAVKYGLNVSLFERMVTNGVEYCRLSLQQRMRPEVAALIVPHIYPNLENHKVVTTFENIKGVDKNVFFLSHCFSESSENGSKSRVNHHEAKFLIQFCRYLLLQGYDSTRITVLTTYSGQLLLLKSLATNDVKKVYFTVVDNFQGEENDIILISFVRSNEDGNIGFLNVSNRVCVALSRAKKGLFCIGNFDQLAEKSSLWQNIVATLNAKQCIGPYLRLMCQNHPSVSNFASSDEDFKKIPEGGCIKKCEYRLSCGHTCNLVCHPYDQDHLKIRCEKWCIKTCDKDHPCEKKCFQECYCEVFVDRTLQTCGHTVKAMCGKPEKDIKCIENCVKRCEKGHSCEKKCFQKCDCEVLIERTLQNCGHNVKEKCGKLEKDITCPANCEQIFSCSHRCPKKCGEDCEKCMEGCIKSCENGHLCQKRCSENCGRCEVLGDKTLKRCGHIVKSICGQDDSSIVCSCTCDKLLNCGHKCSKNCGETCEQSCKVMVDKILVKCGHIVKVPCFQSSSLLTSVCSSVCEKSLNCGHSCIKKCGELCVEKCMELIECALPTCGHIVKVPCCIAINSEILLKESAQELFKTCPEPCKDTLPCGHECSGTCGKCYQKRFHIPCTEVCERILFCGHKCQSICSTSCPPCPTPCQNKCVHRKCLKKCSELCNKCTEPCEWSCSHKKCTRLCYEICDRDPCNEPCMEILPCSHPCIGYCGEPCPKICRRCYNENTHGIFHKLNDSAKYVLLEDCGHAFERNGLNRWMAILLEGDKKIRMKTCPMCETVIRNNLRYNIVVKDLLLQLESVKQTTIWNKERNREIQRALVQKSVTLNSCSYFEPYNSLNICLSSYKIRNVKELTDIENIITIGTGLNWKNMRHISFSDKHLKRPQFLQSLTDYADVTSRWVANFILKYFLDMSEHQLLQLTYEVHRLRFIGMLLQFAEPKFTSSRNYIYFEQCSQQLLNYAPFNDANIKDFETSFKILISKYDGNKERLMTSMELPYLKAMDMSSGHWYKCSMGHAYCITAYIGTIGKDCYVCTHKLNIKSIPNPEKLTDMSLTDNGNESLNYSTDERSGKCTQSASVSSSFEDTRLIKTSNIHRRRLLYSFPRSGSSSSGNWREPNKSKKFEI